MLTARRIVVAAAFGSAFLLAACSTPSSNAPSSSSGASVKKPSDLKIAFFSSATNNTYLQAGIAGAKEAAAKVGAKLDVFDGQFSAQTQFNQIQNALTGGRYNTFLVEANDGNLLCGILTKQAAAKKIMVSLINQPICGRATKAGDEVWQPGTVTFVGGQTLDVYQAWMKQIMAENPNGGNVAVVSGPNLGANTINLNAALATLKANPKFKIVANQVTDYTTPKAYSAAQTIVQAHPTLNVILSNYSGMTQGVAAAVKAASKLHVVKIYDMGGNKWALGAVKNGEIAGSVMFLPKEEAADAVTAVADFVQGKTPAHFINLTKSKVLPGTPFVSKSNVDKFTAEY